MNIVAATETGVNILTGERPPHAFTGADVVVDVANCGTLPASTSATHFPIHFEDWLSRTVPAPVCSLPED